MKNDTLEPWSFPSKRPTRFPGRSEVAIIARG
jgi:hypothetical protein